MTKQDKIISGYNEAINYTENIDEVEAKIYARHRSKTPIKKDKIAAIESLCNQLGIITYNRTDKYICLKGINGHATIIYSNNDYFTLIVDHLKMMGRDSLRLELNNLLSITRHL